MCTQVLAAGRDINKGKCNSDNVRQPSSLLDVHRWILHPLQEAETPVPLRCQEQLLATPRLVLKVEYLDQEQLVKAGGFLHARVEHGDKLCIVCNCTTLSTTRQQKRK